MCIPNKFPGDTNVAGPGTTLSDSRAGIPNRDPASQDHRAFPLLSTAPRAHRTSVYIQRMDSLKGLQLLHKKTEWKLE